jgi:hypothetical protein
MQNWKREPPRQNLYLFFFLPTKPILLFGEIAAGCVIPWHWHTPNEHLMVVSGTARLEMKDGKPLTLRAGGLALMAVSHVHQFRCQQACQFYVYSDAAFDIHYVNKQGTVITPAEAMKAVRKKRRPRGSLR